MMETPNNFVETLPFFWGIAFIFNVLMGVICFVAIIRRGVQSWAISAVAWIGWWSFSNALSLLINMTMGINYPFSYHQLGLFNETMVNVGFLWFMLTHMILNFGIRGEQDWARIDELRKRISIENLEPKKHEDK